MKVERKQGALPVFSLSQKALGGFEQESDMI